MITTSGDDVAALCEDVGLGDDNWILAEVYLYNSNTNKYQVNWYDYNFPYACDKMKDPFCRKLRENYKHI